jgi:hypothetical protein
MSTNSILDSKYIIQHISYDTIKSTLPVLPVLKNKYIVKPMNSSEVFYEASQLLSMLSPDRFTDSTTWLSIGSILYRISNGSINGLDAWISLSTCKKDICSTYWSFMKPSNESIHTLSQYAREDSYHPFQTYKYTYSQRKMSQLIKEKLQRLKPCHFGEVLYLLCKYEYLYDDENGWYQWKEDKWISCTKDCRTLRNSISVIKEMMMTEYRNMYKNDITEFKNNKRDIEDKEHFTVEDEKQIEEYNKKIIELEDKRTYLLTICDTLDEVSYKKKIITECTDLFYDTDGIIKNYLKLHEVVKNNIDIHNKITFDNTNVMKISPLKLFVEYLVTTDKCKQNIISLTIDELISKCSTFYKKNNIHIKVNHTITRQLNVLNITGITIGVRDRYLDINKTEFNKKEIKEYLCL